MTPLRRGDFVTITGGGKTMEAMVGIASENGVSLVVLFDGMITGHVGAMPLLKDGETYRSIMDNTIVTIERKER